MTKTHSFPPFLSPPHYYCSYSSLCLCNIPFPYPFVAIFRSRCLLQPFLRQSGCRKGGKTVSTYCSFLYISIYGGGTEITATPDSLLTATPRLGKNAAREIQEQTASLFTSENPAAPATMSKIFPRGKRKKKRPRLGAWGKGSSRNGRGSSRVTIALTQFLTDSPLSPFSSPAPLSCTASFL